jgi:ABC-type glutathione transport system ATPase component
MPNELSGGQKQRVAIARALVSSPKIILADEPTGALDSKTSEEVVELLRNVNRDLGITVLIVTHERAVAAASQRVIYLKDGLIENAHMDPATCRPMFAEPLSAAGRGLPHLMGRARATAYRVPAASADDNRRPATGDPNSARCSIGKRGGSSRASARTSCTVLRFRRVLGHLHAIILRVPGRDSRRFSYNFKNTATNSISISGAKR